MGILGSFGSEPVFFRAARIFSTSLRFGKRLRRRPKFLRMRGSALSSAVARCPSTVDATTCFDFLMPTAAMSCPWLKRSSDSVTVADSFGAPAAGLGAQFGGSFSTSGAPEPCSALASAAILNSSLQAAIRAARPLVPSKRIPASQQSFSASGEFTASLEASAIRLSMGSSAMAPGAMLRFTASAWRHSRARARSASSAPAIFTCASVPLRRLSSFRTQRCSPSMIGPAPRRSSSAGMFSRGIFSLLSSASFLSSFSRALLSSSRTAWGTGSTICPVNEGRAASFPFVVRSKAWKPAL
mmetsp:Transcript_47870/g.142972  ORF Transcript_47870/g.142972 Transcript_47870/m.142972 type:complete len:298 (-) Transcript_47870:1769-2662(-)